MGSITIFTLNFVQIIILFKKGYLMCIQTYLIATRNIFLPLHKVLQHRLSSSSIETSEVETFNISQMCYQSRKLGVGDGQGGLAYCGPWGCKESDTTEHLNWTELNWTTWSVGFPYFLQFQSEFSNKEFMIWATVSSWSCFCLLYRASPSLAVKNIINLKLVLTI